MSRRTTIYRQLPWTGGVNSSVESGIIPPNDLVQADNVVFATSGSRLKREGFDYFDVVEFPATVSRSSSGTTRTIVFASAVDTNDLIHVGERLTISGMGNANYNNANCIVASVSTTTITYTFAGASSLTEGSTADTAGSVARNYGYIANHDYWYYDSGNGIKQQLTMVVSSDGHVYALDIDGDRTFLPMDAGATALATTPITSADLRTFNNKCIITYSGTGNIPHYYDAMSTAELFDLPGAPDGEFMQEHLGRLWMNDKADKDYLHFSETFDETKWLGVGDSGAIYVGPVDGDPSGITGIAPPFKGSLVVGKGEKVIQILGDAPENFQIVPMTSGLGFINHKTVVARDFDDLYFMSRRGFHSLLATDATGDFEANFLSSKIQTTFNSWNKQKLASSQAVYIEPLNSVFFAVAEDGQTELSSLWAFNPSVGQPGEWYRWPDLSPRSVGKRLANGVPRILIGTSDGRLKIGQNTRYDDDGASYTYRIKTGTIYPDGDPQTIKGFKRVSLLFKQRGRFSFQMLFKVDNQPAQAFTYTQSITGDELGTEFVLGASILGSDSVLAPNTKQVLGYGRGCTIELVQTGAESQVEIYGFMVEFEGADIADEIKDGN